MHQQRQFDDIRSDYIAHVQNDFMKIIRQSSALEDGEATDDEVRTPRNIVGLRS